MSSSSSSTTAVSSGSSRHNKGHGSRVKDNCLGSVINRALTSNSQWPDKDEFLDVIYWGRQVLGVALGLVWGFIPLKGFVGLFLFCVINAALVYFYASSFQGIDEEEFGGMWELTKEGFVTSFAGFLVMWIILYSGLHYD